MGHSPKLGSAPWERRRYPRRSLSRPLLLVFLAAAARASWWFSNTYFMDDSRAPDIDFSHLDRRNGGGVAWGLTDEKLQTTVLPAPHDDHLLTIVQAVVRSQEATYREAVEEDAFLEVLVSLREMNPPDRADTDWQILVRNATFTQGVTCVLEDGNGWGETVEGSFKVPWAWDVDPADHYSGAALLLHCPIRQDWLDKTSSVSIMDADTSRSQNAMPAAAPLGPSFVASIALSLEDTPEPFLIPPVVMSAYYPPPPTEVGLCLAPIFGQWRDDRVVDWVEHHGLLGIKPVHVYGRNPGIGDWVDEYSKFTGVPHTFRHAPPVSPETFGTDKLAAEGLYGDQVIYALDCMMRSIYLGPSKWLGFLDLDEYFLMDPLPATPAEWEAAGPKFLNSFGDDTPSISLGRTHHMINDPDRESGGDLRPRISYMEMIRSPHREDWPGNHKHFHRVDGVISTSVHAPAELYPGFVYMPPVVPAPARIMHFGTSVFAEGPFEKFNVSEPMEHFMAELRHRKTSVLRRLRSRWADADEV